MQRANKQCEINAEVYRDLLWNAVSEWLPNFHSLCRVHQSPNLPIIRMIHLHFMTSNISMYSDVINNICSFRAAYSVAPFFSTVRMHFSTKLGTVDFSCWQRLCKWHPKTFSVREEAESHQNHSTTSAGNEVEKHLSHLWCIPCLWQTAAWAAWGETSSVWCGPSSDRTQMLSWIKTVDLLMYRKTWIYKFI